MKVNYFAYCLENEKTGQRVLFDLRKFLKAFCRLKHTKFKSQFIHQDENVYLFYQTLDTYLFLITRSNELIKKINTESLAVDEIHSLLADNEQLGFASYVLFKEDHFGFGSTLLAPKLDVFTNYINQLLQEAKIASWQFVPLAIMHQATRDNALNLNFLGKTTIEVNKDNTLYKDLINVIKGNVDDTLDLSSFELTMKPKARQNIKPVVDKLLNEISDKGLEKFIVRAKSEVSSQMMDLYLIGHNAVSDTVNKDNEAKIPMELGKKYNNNELLPIKLAEYRSNENFEENSIKAIVSYHNDNSWSDLVADL
jgi:hypothetical protein